MLQRRRQSKGVKEKLTSRFTWMSSLTEYKREKITKMENRRHHRRRSGCRIQFDAFHSQNGRSIQFHSHSHFWCVCFEAKLKNFVKFVNFNDFLNPLVAVERLCSTLFWLFQRIEFLDRWCHAAQDERRRRKKPSELVLRQVNCQRITSSVYAFLFWAEFRTMNSSKNLLSTELLNFFYCAKVDF